MNQYSLHTSGGASSSSAGNTVSPTILLQWVNGIMMNTINNNSNTRRQLNNNHQNNISSSYTITSLSGSNNATTAAAMGTNLMTALPLRSITDLSSLDYAQLIVAIRPTTSNGSSTSNNTAAKFTFNPPSNTQREIHEAHLRNYRSAVQEMGPLISLADAVGAVSVKALTAVDVVSGSSVGNSNTAPALYTADPRLSLPQRLCQGDLAAHQALLSAIYSQRRLFNNGNASEYDWVKNRQRLEEKEMMPDGKPLAWSINFNTSDGGKNNNNAAVASSLADANNRHISLSEIDRATLHLLTETGDHLNKALKLALSLPIYLATPSGITTTAPSSSAASGNNTNGAAAVDASVAVAATAHFQTKEPVTSELFSMMLLALGAGHDVE